LKALIRKAAVRTLDTLWAAVADALHCPRGVPQLPRSRRLWPLNGNALVG
jgi:hypothetical protein